MRHFIGALILSLVAMQAQGEEMRYVGDTIVITLRAGMGDEYKILKTLPSGTAMELLEEKGEFGRVRLKDGTVGWVRLQYLLKQPIARDLLEKANQRLITLEKENQRMKSELGSLTARNKELDQQRQRLEQDNLQFNQENKKLQALAAKPMELDRENTRLSAENSRLAGEMKQISAENLELRNSTVQKWFMAGSAVLLAGVLVGFILPKLGRRRTSNW